MKYLKEVKRIFDDPGREYRSVLFWSWNDELDPDEIERQIHDMKDKGLGGFFMHSRDGLETDYMGEAWMDCVKRAVNTAKKLDMDAWIYDEDRWPSGSAGGLIPAAGENDKYRAKGLTVEVLDGPFINDGLVIALYNAVLDNTRIIKYERLDIKDGTDPREGCVLLVFRSEVTSKAENFHDDTPVDTFEPDAVRAFLDVAYEPYKKELGGDFGETIPGVFTDEPNVADGFAIYPEQRSAVPWTNGFTEYFLNKRGYDILDDLPYIFFDGQQAGKVRHDYWRTLTERFSESYPGQIGRWCEDNMLEFSGHFLHENNLWIAAKLCGAMMPHYRYMHVPGIDILGRHTDEYLALKQCTSVANQYGRRKVVSEMYGCTGWDLTFELQKWIGDWQYVSGVNLRCQHLGLYSLKGCRKRDFPPSFNYNTPWWKYNKVIEDYFARILAVLDHGRVCREILVIHPSTTVWQMMVWPYKRTPDARKILDGLNAYSEKMNNFAKTLLQIHRDFDFGDEIIMSEEGSTHEGKLRIRNAVYSVVIIPPLKTMLKTTFELLKEFISNGGKVIAIKPLPYMIEGEDSKEIEELFNNDSILIADDESQIDYLLDRVSPALVQIRTKQHLHAGSIQCMLKENDDFYALFAVNNDMNNKYETDIILRVKGCVEEWDLLSGKSTQIEVDEETGHIRFSSMFDKTASRLFIIKKDGIPLLKKDHGSLSANPVKSRRLACVLGPECSFIRTEPNVLVLDKCAYKLEEDEWSMHVDVWEAQKAIREKLDMRPVHLNGGMQRYKWVKKPHVNDGRIVYFRFEFDVIDAPENPVYLALESSKHFSINLNGLDIANDKQGWFLDKSMDKIRLAGLKQGTNTLMLRCAYSHSMEVEDCYIIGDFAVDKNRRITKEADMIHFGDWCLQGYPHYCGSIVYKFKYTNDAGEDEKTYLELGANEASVAVVYINGKTGGYIPWRAASTVDLSGCLIKGVNDIDIEIVGTPRNLLGPLHQAANMYDWVEAKSFRRQGAEYTPDYVIKPYGLFDQTHIFIEKDNK